jgi:SAM-dependent methyltransferase
MRCSPESVRAARDYDAWFETPWGRYAFGVEARAVLRALGDVRGALVLEAGCGTGRFGETIAGVGASVAGLDLDAAMLRVASERVRFPLVLADGHRIPFQDGAFDAAVAVTLCEFTSGPEQVVAELVRVTRPGARVVVAALNRRSPWGIAHRRRFRRPLWDTARFFSREELLALGAPHGRARITSHLYAPGAFPGLRFAGPVLEGVGRFVPGFGAFHVLVIEGKKREPRGE